jgi:hypothetical protein
LRGLYRRSEWSTNEYQDLVKAGVIDPTKVSFPVHHFARRYARTGLSKTTMTSHAKATIVIAPHVTGIAMPPDSRRFVAETYLLKK